MTFNQKFAAFHAFNDVIFNVFSNKLFVTCQIIHIDLTQRTSRPWRNSKNSEICFWIFFLKQRGRATAFLTAIPAGETVLIGVSIFFVKQLTVTTQKRFCSATNCFVLHFFQSMVQFPLVHKIQVQETMLS